MISLFVIFFKFLIINYQVYHFYLKHLGAEEYSFKDFYKEFWYNFDCLHSLNSDLPKSRSNDLYKQTTHKQDYHFYLKDISWNIILKSGSLKEAVILFSPLKLPLQYICTVFNLLRIKFVDKDLNMEEQVVNRQIHVNAYFLQLIYLSLFCL